MIIGMKYILYLLAFIAAINISISVFITINKIVDYEHKNGSKGYGSALFFIFTVIGLYAMQELAKYIH